MRIEGIEIIAAEGKYVHRKGSDTYFTRGTLLTNETLDSFEEVDTIPETLPTFDYNEEVNSLIRQRYSVSEEFALLRQRDIKPDEFKVYNDYCEECKAKVKSRLVN